MPDDWTLVYNEDNDLLAHLPPENAADTLRSFLTWTVDQLPIDVWELLCATPDLCHYESRVGEIRGRRLMPKIERFMKEEGGHGERSQGKVPAHDWHKSYGLELLLRQGLDPLALHIEVLRPLGIKVMAEMRMSDTHHRTADPDVPLVSQLLLDHPEYVIQRVDGMPETALDYSHEEVRAYRLAILRELAEEHDVDGLSLNFMRWAKHFERDRGRDKVPIMTDFVGQVRRILDEAARRRGVGRLLLGARVLSTVDECLGSGLDVGAWIRRGYMDYVIPSEHNCTWPALNVEQFAAMAAGSGCRIYGHINDMVGGTWDGEPKTEDRDVGQAPQFHGYKAMLNTEEEARATASNLRAWGAQGIGYWNLPNNFNPVSCQKWGRDPKHRERIGRWARAVANPEAIAAGPRRYHYLPLYKRDIAQMSGATHLYEESGRSLHGAYKGPVIYFHEGRTGERMRFAFRMADGRDGGRLRGTLRYRVFHCVDADALAVDINDVEITPDRITHTVDTRDPDLSWSWFEIDLSDCPPLRGDNEMGLTWRGPGNDGPDVPYMEELDVMVDA
ncbi:MAG: hypothetical protein CMJ18_25925 [Phycisphaeraceae bacterium]|nr:hypothetical protein [Phycisphaeraceae bacterium]